MDDQFYMSKLFEVYNKECNNSEIKYTCYDAKKNQYHIVLHEWIEIIYYVNLEKILFVFARGDGGQEYFFDTYKEAIDHWDMSDEDFEKYDESITL